MRSDFEFQIYCVFRSQKRMTLITFITYLPSKYAKSDRKKIDLRIRYAAAVPGISGPSTTHITSVAVSSNRCISLVLQWLLYSTRSPSCRLTRSAAYWPVMVNTEERRVKRVAYTYLVLVSEVGGILDLEIRGLLWGPGIGTPWGTWIKSTPNKP